MKKSVYSSICIVMLMGLLPFSPKAQDTVIYPYMNYLNMPCDDPSVYFCPKSHAACSNNSGAYTCEKTVYAAGASYDVDEGRSCSACLCLDGVG